MINRFPINYMLGYFILYIVVALSQICIDLGLRTYTVNKNSKFRVQNEGYRLVITEELDHESDNYKDAKYISNYILLIYKISSIGILYPILAIKYETCMAIKYHFFIYYSFYMYLALGGFILSNGFNALLSWMILKNSKLKYPFTCILAIFSGLLACLFTCGACFIRNGCGCSAFFYFPFALISFLFAIYVVFYLIFSLAIIPLITITGYNIGLGSIFVVRLLILAIFDIRRF